MSIKNRGFGSLKKNDPERFREITSRGGKKYKERFYDNPENARKAINKRWDKYRQLKEEADEWNN